jgi:AraC family transcriptional regulator of adaptative response/methylated-DNA-[protein]-cysteine methyltransferase
MVLVSRDRNSAAEDAVDAATVLKTATVRPDGDAVDADAAWKQLARRDPRGRFFYGVLTTGVFCLPGCASRLPRRENVRFFATAAEALAAGFRPCRRCRPEQAGPDFEGAAAAAIRRVRLHIEAHADRAVSLAELGRVAGMSPFTVQRRFKQAMGATPLAWQRTLRAASLRQRLKEGESVTDAVYAAGFGSSSRACEDAAPGMTLARFAQGGRGERIGVCSAPSPFGWIAVGATRRGLCWLALAADAAAAEATVRAEFPAAEIFPDPSLAHWVETAVAMVAGESNLSEGSAAPQAPQAPAAQLQAEQLDLRGTAFQLRVWEALRRIPVGQTLSYSGLARALGDPKATRAVARACAVNRVAMLVPCHRIVGADGSLTGYRWGVERKRMLLEAERGRVAGNQARKL